MSSERGAPKMFTTPTRFELDGASQLPPLHAITHDVQVLLETVGYLGIVVIDLQPLDVIEQEYGRAVYNDFILQVAQALGDVGREALSSGDLLCSIAPYGEQLALFLEGPRRSAGFTPRELEQVVDRMWLALAPRILSLLRPFDLHAKARLGYALVLSNVMVQPERLIYRGIEEARRMAVDYERRMSTRAREILRDILVNRQLRMVFQPVVEITSADVRGYEALVRGPAQSGFGTPATLFELAGNANLTGELVRACFECAFDSVYEMPLDSSLFLNVTPALLHDEHFRRRVLAPDGRGVPPGRIVLELSEHVAVRNYDFLARSLREAREAGVRLAIDDMGVGYSNLNHLLRLQPDYLKLDISLIRDVHNDAAKRALIGSMVVAAQAVGAHVIAEGIEQEAEREALIALGVPLAQGFLFGYPSPEFALPAL